ncbi:MAG TPA: lysine exporter LysO family protein [Candidatus Avirikenella pullistercoris]|nr:lysine exporter LysO family protein [Candidatus Avirikenella pullistercoris]
MKGSIIIVSFFILGVILSYSDWIPQSVIENDITIYILYLLMFFVGISVGSDRTVFSAVKQQGFKIFILPIGTIIGTLAGSAITGLLYGGRSLTDCLAVASGFGYYSLSSIFITEFKGAELGTVALVSNVLREIITLLFAPLLAYYFGKLAPISSGGATTMDTTLPIITKVSGKEFIVISVFHGIIVDFSVPFLVTFFCTL